LAEKFKLKKYGFQDENRVPGMPLSLDSFLFKMQADKQRKYVKDSMLVYELAI